MNSERDTCTLYSVLMVWLESYGNYEKKLNRHGHVPKGTEYPRISQEIVLGLRSCSLGSDSAIRRKFVGCSHVRLQ